MSFAAAQGKDFRHVGEVAAGLVRSLEIPSLSSRKRTPPRAFQGQEI